ncbi:M23 family metallopeptidase [soil metagenome]
MLTVLVSLLGSGARISCMSFFSFKTSTTRARFVATLRALSLWLLVDGVASGQDLGTRLDSKESELSEQKRRKGVLTGEVASFSAQVSQLAGEVAVLRNREAVVAEDLSQTQSRLVAELEHLDVLRKRLHRSVGVLGTRLVEIYKADEPDALTVILDSDGFDDVVTRYEYLDLIQDQDSSIVGRVKGLRDDSETTVADVREARNRIAAKRDELARTRAQAEQREQELAVVRDSKAAALDSVNGNIGDIEDDVSDLNDEIEEELRSAQATTTTSDPLPAGPIQQGSGGMVFPVNGTITSPFGYRWGRLHAGIDIAVAEGTPIRAAKSGTVALAEYYGGYGNYTCVDHGGGLSTCYGHQSGFAVSSGDQVEQGEVIGYSGNTGSSTGPHLHFEVRVDGTPVDPMSYL